MLILLLANAIAWDQPESVARRAYAMGLSFGSLRLFPSTADSRQCQPPPLTAAPRDKVSVPLSMAFASFLIYIFSKDKAY